MDMFRVHDVPLLKEMVHTKMQVLSSFTLPFKGTFELSSQRIIVKKVHNYQ